MSLHVTTCVHVLMYMYMCTCISFTLDQRKVDSARVDKEMAQLRKMTRKKDNQIKSLQSDARRRELVLKRRQEEVHVHMYSLLVYYTHTHTHASTHTHHTCIVMYI